MNSILNIVSAVIFICVLFGLEISQNFCRISSSNPSSIYLSNGNLFIIHKMRIDICDENLNINKTSITFSNDEQITTDKLSKVTISKFEDGYIIALINDLIYIFDNEGNSIFNEISQTDRVTADYYSLIGKNNYFYISFIKNNNIQLLYYEYNKKYNYIKLIASNTYFEDNTLQNICISGHIMKHNTKGEVFTCFYITTQNDNNYFRIRFFAKDGGLLKENSQFTYKSFECPNVNYLKTDINSDHSKVLICFILSTGENYCFSYDINSD